MIADNFAINDGGHDMYDRGNYISFSQYSSDVNAYAAAIAYGTIYNDTINNTGYWVSSKDYWPHIAVTYTGNTNRSLTICCAGNSGSDGSGQIQNLTTSYSIGIYSGYIYINNNYGASDPTIGDVWFTITSSVNWSSSALLTTDTRKTDDSGNYTHYITFTGINFILCKVLLSKFPTSALTTTEVINYISNWVNNIPSNVFS